MRVQSAITTLLGTLVCASNAAVAEDKGDAVATTDESIVPGAYIVEFDGDEDPNELYRDIQGDGVEVEHRMDLKFQLFKGASFHLKTDSTKIEEVASKIAMKPKVKEIWPVRKISFPKPDTTLVGNNVQELAQHMKRQEGVEKSTFTPHLMTQVDRLLAEGYTGKGLRIGLVDTGVDYNHPALGGCFGKGCLIEYGYDFNGDNDTSPVPIPDPDPYDGCVGHGTHVAGIIAAQLNEYNFTGAAPGVKLGMYKATGCGGETTNEMLIAGFNAAFEDGSDIISCSAGDDSGWASDPWAMAASRIAAAGVPVVVAPGNSGHLGLWYPSTPASGVNVTAVGSVENSVLPSLLKAGAFSMGNTTQSKRFGLRFGSPSYQENVTLPLWSVGNDTTSETDACNPLPDGTPDLSDKVVLLRMSTVGSGCTPEIQAGNVAAKGGRYLLWYSQTNSNVPDLWIANESIAGVAGIPSTQGAEFIALLEKGDVTVDINDWTSAGLYIHNLDNNPAGGYTSHSSSWGPTQEINVKPQITTPGGDILSTYPLRLGGYAVLSGTSMATPLLAAIYALIAEVRGTRDPEILRSLVSSTAKPKVWFDGETAHNEILAPVAQQGAGIAQAWDAAHATTLLSESSLSFNDSDHFVGERSFTIRNTASEDVTYTLGHTKALTMYTFADSRSPVLDSTTFPNPTANDWATLEFPSKEITVPAGAAATVNVILTPPQNINATLLPVYSGYITLQSTKNESLVLPYLGVLGSLYKTPVVQAGYDGGVYLSDTNGHFNIPRAANTTFTLNRPGSNTTSNGVIYPKLVIAPTLGAAKLRADVVALSNVGLQTTKWKGYNVVGSLPGFPLSLVPRNGATSYFRGVLDDGTVLPEGAYKFITSGVRVFGDAAKDEDWDVVETVTFTLKYLS